MRGRHWEQVSQLLGTRVGPGEELQLQRLIKINVLGKMQELQVCVRVRVCLRVVMLGA
jgi:hypothetical protein